MTFSFLDGWWTDAGTFESLLRAANLVAQSEGEAATFGRAEVLAGRSDASLMAAREVDTHRPAAGKLWRPGTGSPRMREGHGRSHRRRPTSKDLIDGVRVQATAVHPDDRGYFLEVQRIGQGLAADFPPETTQISAALNYPGTIKAFHFHLHQTDCWTPVKGMLQVALVDLRVGSPTFGRAIRSMSARCGPGRF